jgi:hypothetical protein
MRNRTKKQRPTKAVVGRLVIALIKGTGVRPSAEDVQVLQPMIEEAVRAVRREGREDEPLGSSKRRPVLH